MNAKKEARQIISAMVEQYRDKPYEELTAMVGAEPITGEVIGESGRKYQYEIQVIWDDCKKGDVRLMGSIDPTPALSIFHPVPLLKWIPLTISFANDSFIKNAQGQFVGE